MAFSELTDAIGDAVVSYKDRLLEAVKSPAFSITLGGQQLTQLDKRLLSLSLTDNRGFAADTITLTIDDSDGQLALPARGVELAVSLGWAGEPLIYKGLYTLDEITHSGPADQIKLTARSTDFTKEFNVKREVSWHDITVEQLVSAIARRYQLKVQISEMLMNIAIDHADQTQETDFSFLTRMADTLGAIATVKNGYLLFILPGGGVSASGKALPSAVIPRSSSDRHSLQVADRDAYTEVQGYWLDLDSGARQKVSVTKRTGKAQTAADGEKRYTEGAQGNIYVLRKTYPNQETARRAAAAKWQQLQRGSASFSITLGRGRPELYPEMHVTLSGFKDVIDQQDWVIAKVEHTVSGSGYTTKLELEAKTPDWIVENE